MLMTGFAVGTITSVEKRFGLSSTETGSMPSAAEISGAVIGVIASYCGDRGHKGRYLSIGALVMAVGAFTYSIPHFATGKYVVASFSSNYTDLCLVNSSLSSSTCDASLQIFGSSNLRNFFFLFLIAELLMGAGNNLIWSIGITYLDENVPPVSSPLYVSAIYTISMIGPSLGYIIVSIFLKVFVNWPEAAPPGLIPADARWIGAWWLSFVISAACLTAASIPLFGFPRELPGYEAYKRTRQEQAKATNRVDKGYGNSVSDFLKASRDLFKNIPFVCLTITGTFDFIAVNGIGWFFPKILETQFHLSPSEASLTVGYISIIGGCIGMLLGGLLLRAFKLKGRGAAKLTWIISICDCIAFTVFLLGCSNLPFAGVNSPYGSNSSVTLNPRINTVNLTASCNTNCMCNSVKYNAICGSDGTTYYSPCHAMPAAPVAIPIATVLQHCIQNVNRTRYSYDAIQGSCISECPQYTLFVIGISISMVSVMAKTVPAIEAILRCVADDQRSYGLGLMSSLVRITGNIPGPLIIGAFIDQSCILWTQECTSTRTCWLYDSRNLAKYLYGSMIFVKIVSTTFYVLSWWFYDKGSGKSLEEENNLLDIPLEDANNSTETPQV
ncbi:Solute carrier organic anion transporter family member 4A1 [Trichoplax sp. H2]|nr:Solute carrier organic anion transporter family member 4A1 [Trichoplax sp. H2]|eukprot:RDD38714.1 Solute carrier organic anion transporter family member 4A1 [Trichoplax sp. H2]